MDEPQTRMTKLTEDEWVELLERSGQTYHRLNLLVVQALDELEELRHAARTPSVEPPREMVERVRQAIVDTPVPESHREAEDDKFGASLWDTEIDALAESLAALLTSVRSQAIEMCAARADREAEYWSRMMEGEMPSAMREQLTQRWSVVIKIAASIRSLR